MNEAMAGITIELNGKPLALGERTVADLLERMGHGSDLAGIAVAVNDRVVARSEWVAHRLEDGDRVEIVGAVQGG